VVVAVAAMLAQVIVDPEWVPQVVQVAVVVAAQVVAARV
jgi:hypothetical protein